MYDFTRDQRDALSRLPTTAARLALERWVELTHEDTHPFWRARPCDGVPKDLAERLEKAIQANDISMTPLVVANVCGTLLASGRARDWQHNAVKTFLIDPKGKYAKTDFFDRLRLVALGQSSRPEAGERGITLEWPITHSLPASAKLPWTDTAFRFGDREYRVIERGKGAGSQGQGSDPIIFRRRDAWGRPANLDKLS